MASNHLRFARWLSLLACCVAIIWGSLAVRPADAENWPAWRGPDGVGVSADKELPLHWSATQNIRWRASLPDKGNSTPVIWGDRVFVTQALEKEDRRTVMCLSRADGKLLWQSGITYKEHEPTNGQNPYCSASPATDGQRVIACFGSAGLYCYDMEGKELWHRELGEVDSWHGSGSSPIIHGDLCFLNFGPGTNAALVACNKQTGSIVWKVAPPTVKFSGFGGFMFRPRPAAPPKSQVPDGNKQELPSPAPDDQDPPQRRFGGAAMQGDMTGSGGFMGSWGTPVMVHASGHDELLVAHATQVIAYEPQTGKPLWTCKGLTEQVIASPAIGEGVLVATGHLMTGGTQAIAIKLGGSGDVTNTHRLWQVKLSKECVGSPVISGGCAYLVTDFGTLVCLDLATGKKLTDRRLAGTASRSGSWSSLLLADGKLWVTDLSAEVFILSATPQLELLATNSLGDQTMCASPAVCDHQIFLRTYEALWCIAGPEQ